MRTVGTVVRCANTTSMPFDRVARSILGKVRSLIASTAGGELRSTAVSGFEPVARTGAPPSSTYLGLRYQAGDIPSRALPPATDMSDSLRSPGSTTRRKPGLVSHLATAARMLSGVAAAAAARSFLYFSGSFE